MTIGHFSRTSLLPPLCVSRISDFPPQWVLQYEHKCHIQRKAGSNASPNYELYILKRRNGKLSVDLLHSSAFSNAFKIRLLQKMHNPADHIFPPQWLVKAFKFWSLNHLMTRTSILQQKGLSICCSTEFPTTLPQPSEESSNKQADTNCVSLQQRQTLITYKGALLKTPSHPQTF